MPLPVAHGLCGASIIAATHPDPTKQHYLPIFVGIVLANAADSDFLLVLIFQSRDWHRDFTHSIVFSLVVFLFLLLALDKRRKREAIAYGLAYASHGLLDYLTTKEGAGVKLLWPFSQVSLGLGWIGLSELPSRLPAIGIIKAVAMEFLLFTPLFVLILLSRKYLPKTSAP
jgi:membrane-bound metal-dependent hydrolase YbcI (DUF457 family)